jgi:hypothetical protein
VLLPLDSVNVGAPVGAGVTWRYAVVTQALHAYGLHARTAYPSLSTGGAPLATPCAVALTL